MLVWVHFRYLAVNSRANFNSNSVFSTLQIVLAVARLFWLERKMKKAKEWFIKAVKLDPDLGDTWATYYKFTAAHGTEDELKILVSLKKLKLGTRTFIMLYTSGYFGIY